MTTVYVLIGTTGEYSDREEWVVHIFSDKQKAEEWKKECDEDVKRWEEKKSEQQYHYYDMPQNWSKFDPHMHYDYTGTDYRIEESVMD